MTFGPEAFQIATDVSRETLERFHIYAALLKTWQKKINLIGPATMDEIWKRHFLDSAQLFSFVDKIPFEDDSRSWLDLGTGAGFPGLVLSLLGEHPIYLVEKNAKKCAFLRQVIRETGSTAEVLQSDVKTLKPFPVAIITSRALATIEQILSWGLPFLAINGEFWLLKGVGVEEELTFLEKTQKMKIDFFPSLTHSGGKIVRLYGIKKKGSNKR